VAGRYRLVEKVGEGSIGTVHLCEDLLLGQRFAIKILKPVPGGTSPALDAFLNEARVAIALNHPHIVRVFHLDLRDGVCYILQEYLEGKTLEQVLGETVGHRLDEDRVVDIARALAGAMAYAHEHGVIHRDLSPGNVMMDERGGVKLLDFGVAAYRGLEDRSQQAATVDVAGTPQYMSPEHWDGNGAVDRRSDIYSLGAILYTLLCGSVPFPCDSCEELRTLCRTSRPKPLLGASPALRRVVERCLDPDPDMRWQDFARLGAELETVRAAPAPAAAAPPAHAARGLP